MSEEGKRSRSPSPAKKAGMIDFRVWAGNCPQGSTPHVAASASAVRTSRVVPLGDRRASARHGGRCGAGRTEVLENLAARPPAAPEAGSLSSERWCAGAA